MKSIAIYLPQFHPIPENDRWWGKGFTEWTNVTRARPQFKGHYQPHLPADLGFYDLRLPEVRQAQADLARSYGIDGFCYYHYWFNSQRLLQRPFEEVLASGKPDFPFCLCWANENWTRRWDGGEQHILMEQKYSADDDLDHIRALLPAFQDPRYIRVGGKPLFLIYRTTVMPEPAATAERWRREAERAGLPGLFLVRVESFAERIDPGSIGFDASLEFAPTSTSERSTVVRRRHVWRRFQIASSQAFSKRHVLRSYKDLVDLAILESDSPYPRLRCVCPSWDNTSRRKQGANIFFDANPADFQRWVTAVAQATQRLRLPGVDEPLMFINAWNEWAEGNHLEPCQRWGLGFLEAYQRGISGQPLEPLVSQG